MYIDMIYIYMYIDIIYIYIHRTKLTCFFLDSYPPTTIHRSSDIPVKHQCKSSGSCTWLYVCIYIYDVVIAKIKITKSTRGCYLKFTVVEQLITIQLACTLKYPWKSCFEPAKMKNCITQTLQSLFQSLPIVENQSSYYFTSKCQKNGRCSYPIVGNNDKKYTNLRYQTGLAQPNVPAATTTACFAAGNFLSPSLYTVCGGHVQQIVLKYAQ